MTGRRGDRVPLDPFVPTALLATFAALFGWAVFLQEHSFQVAVFVVVGATVVGVLMAMLLVSPQARRPAPPAKRPTVGEWWPEQETAPLPAGPDRRPEPPAVEPAGENPQLVLPVDGAAPSGRWWEQGTPAMGTRTDASARPSPRDLAELRDSARVVQCPRCGAFRIDVTHVGTGYAFRCRVDDHEWTWRPGTAWPVTVVASRRRTDR
jgi:hypothetical protein